MTAATGRWVVALWRCRLVACVLVGLGLGLTLLPQATDLLIALGQDGGLWNWTELAIATVWLAVNARVWARFALDGAGITWGGAAGAIPDVFSVVPFGIVAAALWSAASGVPQPMRDAVGMAASGADPLRLGAGLTLGGAIAAAALCRVRVANWVRLDVATATVSAGVAAIGLVAFAADPVATAIVIPPAATVLFAAAGLIAGATLLQWAGTRTHIPLTLIVVALALALAVLRDHDVLADNHDVRGLAGPPRARPAVEAAFARFLDQTGGAYAGGPVPVVLVATSGGGIAAAYWTATVLGDLADAAPAFSRQVFAISGVSGGAVGATVHVAIGARGCATARSSRRCGQLALSGDFLGPTLGALLYPDLFQRFVPFVAFDDRQRALERAWEARARAVFGDERFAGPFLDLWAPDKPWPALFLNGTSFATGGRLLASNLAPLPFAADMLEGAIPDVSDEMGAEISASTATGNAARFPYLSPFGVLRAWGVRRDAVADGGYFENLGASTLLDVLDAIEPVARGRARLIVMQIVTDPDIGPDGKATPGRPIFSPVPEAVAGPVTLLLRTRSARGAQASAVLARRVTSLGGVYIPVRLGQTPTGQSAPLSWALSQVARGVIDGQWTDACRQRLLDLAGFAAAPPATGASGAAMWRSATCRGAVPMP